MQPFGSNHEKAITAQEQTQIERNILSTLSEFGSQIEQALINTMFQAIIYNADNEVSKIEMDYLHLLYKIIQDSKKLNNCI